MYKRFFKRLFDLLLSSIWIIIFSLPMMIIALIIKATSPGPVLFKQRRIGIHKSNFVLFKFRTMRIDTPRDMPTHLLANPEQYITSIGSFLRKTSCDELPQLYNIFAGQMSIIGPRPALWNQDDLIAERDKYGANDIRPGLTGLAQISGRDELSITDKATLDGVYKQKMGLFFDCKVFFRTIKVVLLHDGFAEGKNERAFDEVTSK